MNTGSIVSEDGYRDMQLVKKGFTLIEVMISIVLIGILVAYLYGVLENLRHSTSLLEKRDRKLSENEIFLSLIRKDILEASTISISNGGSRNSILSLETTNSIYNSHICHVKWFLNLDSNQLIRAESPIPFRLPVPVEKLHFVRFDIFQNGIEEFHILQSKDKKSLLLYSKELNTTSIFAIELGVI